jgi:hypothetical protein
MGDVVFLLLAGAFFASCVAYVRGCERLVRADESSDTGEGPR